MSLQSLPICQTLPSGTLQCHIGTIRVQVTEFLTMIPFEIKLRRIALKMFLADMVRSMQQQACYEIERLLVVEARAKAARQFLPQE